MNLLKILPWVFLWAAINTGIDQLREPDSIINVVHNARAFLPLIIGALCAIGIVLSENKAFWLFRGPLEFFGLYGVAALFSTILFSPNYVISLYWGVSYLTVLVALFFVLSRNSQEKNLGLVFGFNKFFVITIALIAAVLVIFWGNARFGLFPPFVDTVGRVVPNGIGRFAALAALFSLSSFFSAQSVLKKSAWTAFGLASAIVLFISHSRSAMLAFLFAGLFVIVAMRPKLLKFIIPAGIIIIILGTTFFGPQIQEFIHKNPEEENFYSNRVRIWLPLASHVQKSPVFGYGYHGDRLFGYDHAHNALLHAAVQSGIVGLIFFMTGIIWALFCAVKLLWARSNQQAVEAGAIIVFFAVRGIAESSGAFFGVDWLLMAPSIALLTWHAKRRHHE